MELSALFIGEASCLGAAFLWAVCVALFRSPVERYGAPTINLLKCLLATFLLGLTVLMAGQYGDLLSMTRGEFLLITISGVIGITVGDTALFAALALIGPYRTLLLQTLSPLFAALLAAVWLKEIPTTKQAGGAVLILCGVAVVVAPRISKPGWKNGTTISAAGLAFGVLAAFGQGTGLVMAKVGMSEVPTITASFLRLLAATVGMLALGTLTGGFARAYRVLSSPRVAARVGGTAFLGTYVAMLLFMAGVNLAPAAVAAVLLSVTPVFSLFIDAWTLGEKITVRGLAGTALAVAGVAVLANG